MEVLDVDAWQVAKYLEDQLLRKVIDCGEITFDARHPITCDTAAIITDFL
jgi:hypothetical protein